MRRLFLAGSRFWSRVRAAENSTNYISGMIEMFVTEHSGYLSARLEGAYAFAEIAGLVKRVRDECAERGCERIMIDIRGVGGDIPSLDRFQLGKAAGEIWGGELKVLVLSPRDASNKLFENTAVNRLARVQVTHDEHAGMAWLLAA
jgi:hypothetical protein